MQTLPISERPPPGDAPGAGHGGFLRQLPAAHRLALTCLLSAAAVLAAQGVLAGARGTGPNAFARAHDAVRTGVSQEPQAFDLSPALGALMRALGALPSAWAATLFAALALAALATSLGTTARLAAGPPGRALAWLTWLPAVLMGWPLATALRGGAPEPLLVLAALLGVRAAGRSATAATAAWLGLACALHPACALLGLQQAARGDRRGAARVLAVASALVALGAWSLGEGASWEPMASRWAQVPGRDLALGAPLVLLALALPRLRPAARGSAPSVREAALALAALAPWVPGTGTARALWLLLPLAAVLHTALDPSAPRAWRVLAAGASALATLALLPGPGWGGVGAAAALLALALAAELGLQGTNWSRYQPGRR